MITERSTGIHAGASLDETVKLMNEMDRLLGEMKDTMRTIKRILGEDDVATTVQASPSELIRGS